MFKARPRAAPEWQVLLLCGAAPACYEAVEAKHSVQDRGEFGQTVDLAKQVGHSPSDSVEPDTRAKIRLPAARFLRIDPKVPTV
jgi:hypothetical protein